LSDPLTSQCGTVNNFAVVCAEYAVDLNLDRAFPADEAPCCAVRSILMNDTGVLNKVAGLLWGAVPL
jgi:hypothetical protein